ncbi:hypothetical protein FA13DRAFT_1686816 [Coprinellus micaceus]|uniref:Uncharacterized protein n=1 Tax=Coprinellus micaceus TaxID=71717 RepID=A0A4Y7TGK1_COPMI|nr:hypothetical protein FA13DRAFT_1686816 [Coprinellus micaceus]
MDQTLEETTFCIPYSGKGDNEIGLPNAHSILEDNNHSHGSMLRAYKQAWDRCLERIQTTVQELLEPHVEDVVKKILDDTTVPGLPNPELPVISISNPIFGASFLNDVCERLDTPSVHIYPSDCVNITSAMRALVTGLVETVDIPVKHRAATSLATFDINYLSAWYKQLEDEPTLLVVLHNFEEFDPSVMQDVFYICSQHLPQLPLSFILSLSTPLPTYLHMVYPRATLSHLRIRDVAIPNGMSVLNEILSQTFFSPDFTPDVIPGPASLEYIADFFSRHSRTLDSLITNIQLVHMKHFSVEPLACLVYPIPERPSPAVVEVAFARILAFEPKFSISPEEEFSATETLIAKVYECRVAVLGVYRKLKIAFDLMKRVQLFCVARKYKGMGWDIENGLTQIFLQFLSGKATVHRWVKEMHRIVRLLSEDQLEAFHAEFMAFYEEYVRDGADLLTWERHLGDWDRTEEAPLISEKGLEDPGNLAGYLVYFINDCLSRQIEDIPLWEIWYSGDTPFPSELVNPSIRASILAGLLRPLEFTSIPIQPKNVIKDTNEGSLWRLPDTSILFRRYLDSGRMVNVYDWFESFQAVLETQKEELKKQSARGRKRKASAKGKEKGTKKRASVSSKKQSGKGKGKQRQLDDDEAGEDEMDADGEEGEGEDAEEKWKLEVQARFMRALHELDYLAFIKHTKRRADHVVRTVFEVNE